MAEALLAKGKVGTVLEVCRYLMGIGGEDAVTRLQDLNEACWQQEPPLPAPEPRRSFFGRFIR